AGGGMTGVRRAELPGRPAVPGGQGGWRYRPGTGPMGPVTGSTTRQGTLTGADGSRALSMSAIAIGSAAISRWSLPSRAHWFCTVMLVTFGAAGRNALVYGVTTSSSLLSITV